MPYLLDSNWVIHYLDADQEAVELVDGLVEAGIGISIITYLEVYQGILRSPTRS